MAATAATSASLFNSSKQIVYQPLVQLQPLVFGGVLCQEIIQLKEDSSRPTYFFTEGLAKGLSKEGAGDKTIFPDTNIVVTRCVMMGNLTVEGGDRCSLVFVRGCTDPSSPLFNPPANVDDGSCPPYLNSED